MAKKRNNPFRGRVGAHSKREKAGASYGYLSLPSDISVFKETPGSIVRFDILPYTVTDKKHPDKTTIGDFTIAGKGDVWYRRPFKTHRNVGNDTVLCLGSFGLPCPVCEERNRLVNQDGATDESKALKPSNRQLYIIAPIAEKVGEADWKKLDGKPQLWTISHAMFQKMLKAEIDLDEDYEIFADLEEGLTLEVRFSSETIAGGQPFSMASRIDFKERKKQYSDALLKTLPDLDAIIKDSALTYEALKDKFYEIDEEGEEPEEEGGAAAGGSEPEAGAAYDPDDPEPGDDDPEPDKDGEHDPNACTACGGSGKNSRGKVCRPCKGTGKKVGAEKEEPASDNKCPAGHVFGVDCETKDECDECDGALWEECYDLKTGGDK